MRRQRSQYRGTGGWGGQRSGCRNGRCRRWHTRRAMRGRRQHLVQGRQQRPRHAAGGKMQGRGHIIADAPGIITRQPRRKAAVCWRSNDAEDRRTGHPIAGRLCGPPLPGNSSRPPACHRPAVRTPRGQLIGVVDLTTIPGHSAHRTRLPAVRSARHRAPAGRRQLRARHRHLSGMQARRLPFSSAISSSRRCANAVFPHRGARR